VVAFREGTREAKGQAKNVQRQGRGAVEQGKQQLQRGRTNLGRGELAARMTELSCVQDRHSTQHSALDLLQALSDCILRGF
jgi:hypothetical protein